MAASSRYRPVIGGVSSGNLQTGATGTNSVSVYDSVSGEVLLLSNAHVFGSTGDIIQPGSMDGGGKSDVVAKVKKSSDLIPGPEITIDAAIAKPTSTDIVSNEIKDIGVVRGVVDPEIGMDVFKSGRTTQLTQGVITDVNAALAINYPQGRLNFNDLIFFKGAEPLVMGGDSGSLLITYVEEEPYAVGLVFAGPSSPPYNYGVACKIENVITNLGIAMSLAENNSEVLPVEMPVKLSGIIVDIETLVGIPNVRIIVGDYECFTDYTGSYSIGLNEPGVYTLQMRVRGYCSGDATIELDLGENTASFALTKTNGGSLITYIPILIGVTAGVLTITSSMVGGE